jgi:hypothetical protein
MILNVSFFANSECEASRRNDHSEHNGCTQQSVKESTIKRIKSSFGKTGSYKTDAVNLMIQMEQTSFIMLRKYSDKDQQDVQRDLCSQKEKIRRKKELQVT